MTVAPSSLNPKSSAKIKITFGFLSADKRKQNSSKRTRWINFIHDLVGELILKTTANELYPNKTANRFKEPMKIIPLLSVILFSIFSGFAAEAKAKHKVVFLHGSRSHASGDHEFQAGSHLLAKHLNAQDKVDVEAVVNAGWPRMRAY